MALKLYDKIVPSDEFALVDAEHVEMADGSGLDAFAAEAAVQVQGLGNRITALEQQAGQMGSAAEQAIGQLTSLAERVTALEKQDEAFAEAAEAVVEQVQTIGGKVAKLEKPAVSVDLTAFESAGTIVETHADGSVKTYTMEFDGNGNPTKVTDSNGNVTVLTW